MKNFWQKLNKPFFVLAPMADVTDYAQRQMLAKYGKPDVIYTEFVSADGLANEKGREVLIKDLRFSENERPIVAQIFGAKPENIEVAARLVAEMGFDGVDINMGCPDKNVIKQGAGSALMRNPALAREIIKAAKRGAEDIPVSVKTRIGFNKNEIESWLPEILAEKPAAITIHGRTKKEMSEVDAHWDIIKCAVEIAKGSGVLIIGNGDVKSLEDGLEKTNKAGTDGIMVGRAIFGNPWLFNKQKNINEIPLSERFKVMIEHTKLFAKEIASKNIKGLHVMKKHYKAYVSGFEGAGKLRAKLMEASDLKEIKKIVEQYLAENINFKNL